MRTQVVAVALALACALFVSAHDGPALALTTPLTGATAWPNTIALKLPFPAGHEVYVTSGYGPAMGSSLHDGLDVTGSSNDHYALDLVYANEANGGKGLPIVAALPGTVVTAGWATAGWANYGQRVMLQHDIGDGHTYLTLYAHLDSIDPAITEGAVVTQGQTIGALGESCEGDIMNLSCPFFGPHLHFALHRNSMVGGSGTGGSYGGNAVVPEPMSGHEDLLQGQTLLSDNTSAPCPQVPAAGGVIDESDPTCFFAGGSSTFWNIEAAGYLDTLRWTTATDTAVDNYGVWALDFELAGSYALEVYTDAAFAQSQQATYQVAHGGETSSVTIDQSGVDGWQSLGSFVFSAGGEQSLRLDDATGEPLSADRKLVFDALRLTPENGAAGGAGAGGGAAQGGGGGSTGGSDASGGSAATPPSRDESCSCRTAGHSDASGWLLLLAPLLVSRRRFRAAEAARRDLRPRPRGRVLDPRAAR